MTPTAAAPVVAPRAWEPVWSPEETDPALPPLTLILDPRDHAALTTTALAAHRPSAGRITIHPTPLAPTAATLAHDLMRAYGKHLPAPEDLHPEPAWVRHNDDSWRNTAAWTTTLGITHLIICRAHRFTNGHIKHLLALREHARLKLTLLCNGPLPPNTRQLLSAVRHDHLDTPEAALQHLQHPPPHPTAGNYPWWQARCSFPARPEETWFRLPPPPSGHHRWEARHYAMIATQPPPDARILPLPPTRQDHTHPHLATAIARIHHRIAHPVHAARVALHLLTGAPPDQLNHLPHGDLTPSGSPDHDLHPTASLPLWTRPLTQAALALTELRGYAHAHTPLFIPKWEEHEVSQAIEGCRLLLPAPARTSSAARRRPARRP
ncbi:hypothetical protein [Streptomyces paromomycinus]|uniref:Uncharacterized protein n=1 Tax=Streptomyces paromomycinus TaxID=92743 RepID=A0A401VTG6_STREY|nr:hypothetical protein [Streptomyces paromomycinus]GCD40374.1 hypothetical protein GKJPGBOP_00023 [Streptomyces paromomycinus]